MYLKTAEEMAQMFPSCPQALENTVKIADRCQVDFEFGVTKLPEFKTDEDHETLLRRMCYEGLYRHYGQNLLQGLWVMRISYRIPLFQDAVH
jgi:DNA polymerase-3 subunit alpha